MQLVPLDFMIAYYLMLFVLALIECITSYAICIWFFSKKKDTTKVEKLYLARSQALLSRHNKVSSRHNRLPDLHQDDFQAYPYSVQATIQFAGLFQSKELLYPLHPGHVPPLHIASP
jgi:hypothetical protein